MSNIVSRKSGRLVAGLAQIEQYVQDTLSIAELSPRVRRTSEVGEPPRLLTANGSNAPNCNPIAACRFRLVERLVGAGKERIQRLVFMQQACNT